MPKRAFIIHGFLSHPQEAWLPWLKVELEKRGYVVALPAMPHPDAPVISEWIDFITRLVGQPTETTVMIGHSLGCQGVLRYLETLGFAGMSVTRTVLVAGTFPIERSEEEVAEASEGDPVLKPWFSSGIDPLSVKKAAGRCTVIFSDNDSYITVEKEKDIFRAVLDPTIIVLPGHGHFNDDSGVTELPAALAATVA